MNIHPSLLAAAVGGLLVGAGCASGHASARGFFREVVVDERAAPT